LNILADAFNFLQRDPQNIFFNSKLITRLCWSLESEFILYIGEDNGKLAKINLLNMKTDSVKKITICNLTLISINPLRYICCKIENVILICSTFELIFNRKNIIAVGTKNGEIYISKYD